MNSKHNWNWTAYGKHPVAKDYFQFGQDSPLMKSFSDWVEGGYRKLDSAKKDTEHDHLSWQFWSNGSHKEEIVCGLVKDSCDTIGRPYPFLIMGAGKLKGWRNEWDLLPHACGTTWDHFGYLSTQNFNDITKLEVEIQNIRPPSANWSEFKTARENSIESLKNSSSEEFSSNLSNLKRHALRLSEKAECFIFLDQEPFHNQFMLVDYWHFLFKTDFKTVPNAIFLGGTIDKTYLVLFNRPLNSEDFVHLWNVSTLESKEKGSPVVE